MHEVYGELVQKEVWVSGMLDGMIGGRLAECAVYK